MFGRRFALLVACAVWLAICVAGCAEGYPKEPKDAVTALFEAPAQGNGSAASDAPAAPPPETGGGGGSGGDTAATGGAPDGRVPCQMGETMMCACEEPGSMGTAVCNFATDSPSGGWFSECRACVTPPPPEEPPPEEPPAGTGGMGGSGGAAGGDSGSGGTGGDVGGSGGSGGSGGGSAPPPPPPPPPPPQNMGGGGLLAGGNCPTPCTQACFPIGIIACCNALNLCGCTWAPGGYCL